MAQDIVAGDPAVADAITKAATVVSHDAGSDLLREGDTTDHLVFVLSGGVEIIIGADVVGRFPAPCLVGEMAMLQDAPRRSATVRATCLTVCAELSAAAFKSVAKAHPAVLDRLISIVRSRNPSTAITADDLR